MSDDELTKQVKAYSELAKENPEVDMQLLMSSALESANASLSNRKSYHWPYVISIGAAPLGLIFVIKYYFSDDEADRRAAKICLILTVIGLVFFLVVGKLLLSGSGVSLDQIQTITPKDVQGLTQ
jgi:hypothetical protein